MKVAGRWDAADAFARVKRVDGIVRAVRSDAASRNSAKNKDLLRSLLPELRDAHDHPNFGCRDSCSRLQDYVNMTRRLLYATLRNHHHR